jgi:hypothetical protein
MLWTYTSLKSGLSAWKSESNSGDATISIRMVNEDTLRTWISFIMHARTLDVINQPSIKGGASFYTISDCAACLTHSDRAKSLYDKIAVA